jgi:hypothetical protein
MTVLLIGWLLAAAPAALPPLQGESIGLVGASGFVAGSNSKPRPGDRLVIALDWSSLTRPAQVTLAPRETADQADIAAHRPLALIERDPRAAGRDTIELLLVGLGKGATPPITIAETGGAPIAVLEPLEVETVASIEGTQAEPAPPRAQAEIGWDGAGVALAVGAALLLAALVAWGLVVLVRRAHRPAAAELPPALPAIPPDRQALAALDALLAEGFLARGLIKPFSVRLAEIAKRFFGEQFQVPLLERTTEECHQLLLHSGTGSPYAVWLRQWLDQLDMVKFAGAKPPEQQLSEAADALRQLVTKIAAANQPELVR